MSAPDAKRAPYAPPAAAEAGGAAGYGGAPRIVTNGFPAEDPSARPVLGGGGSFREGWVRAGPVSPMGSLDSPTVRKRECAAGVGPPRGARRAVGQGGRAGCARASVDAGPGARAAWACASPHGVTVAGGRLQLHPSHNALPPRPPLPSAAVTRYARSELLKLYTPSLPPAALEPAPGVTTMDSLAPTLWNTDPDQAVRAAAPRELEGWEGSLGWGRGRVSQHAPAPRHAPHLAPTHTPPPPPPPPHILPSNPHPPQNRDREREGMWRGWQVERERAAAMAAAGEGLPSTARGGPAGFPHEGGPRGPFPGRPALGGGGADRRNRETFGDEALEVGGGGLMPLEGGGGLLEGGLEPMSTGRGYHHRALPADGVFPHRRYGDRSAPPTGDDFGPPTAGSGFPSSRGPPGFGARFRDGPPGMGGGGPMGAMGGAPPEGGYREGGYRAGGYRGAPGGPPGFGGPRAPDSGGFSRFAGGAAPPGLASMGGKGASEPLPSPAAAAAAAASEAAAAGAKLLATTVTTVPAASPTGEAGASSRDRSGWLARRDRKSVV